MSHPAFKTFRDTQKIRVFPCTTTRNFVSERTAKNTNFSCVEKTNKTVTFFPHEEKDKSDVADILKKLHTIDELLSFCKENFADKTQNLSNRLVELLELHDENDNPISVGSLKSMLAFLLLMPVGFKSPRMTLNENGTFQLNWRRDNFNLITLRFKDDHALDYVIFKPSQYCKKHIILNGYMNLFDFAEYLKNLNLYTRLL